MYHCLKYYCDIKSLEKLLIYYLCEFDIVKLKNKALRIFQSCGNIIVVLVVFEVIDRCHSIIADQRGNQNVESVIGYHSAKYQVLSCKDE